MDNEQDHEDEQQPRKIRVVDKRISSRSAGSTPPEPRSETPPVDRSEAAPGKPDAPPPPSPVDPREPATVTPLRPPADEASAAASHPAGGAATAGVTPPAPPAGTAGEGVWTPEQEEEARRMAEEMARIPSLEWVINVSVTLANAAGTKLNAGLVDDAGLAIDALAALVEKVGPHLGDAEAPLRQTLAQLQMAYAQMASGPPQPES
ncbi:MAG: hypothetical protein ACRDJB_11185 [Actinomycetota bacterium]